MLLMLLFEADPIAVGGLVVGIVAAVAAIVGAIAAIYAAVYAKAAPTKDDLARVETNTAHLEEVRSKLERMDSRFNSQQELEILKAKAQRIHISVEGSNDASSAPLAVTLTLKEPSVVLTRVELYNEVGNSFGGADCVPNDEVRYIATLDSQTFRTWMNGGTMQSVSKVRCILRVHMLFDEKEPEVFREMSINLSNVMKQTMNGMISCSHIEGNV
jgi:hypothetical protein